MHLSYHIVFWYVAPGPPVLDSLAGQWIHEALEEDNKNHNFSVSECSIFLQYFEANQL